MDFKYYIGYSTDEENRYLSSSGGIGSALIKYLMENSGYGTSMTFQFNKEECRYEPKLIYDYKEYNNCGSVYQDTDTIVFIKNNLNKIKNGIVVTCMPCQVRPIKSLLNRNNIRHFIISLCCSGQTTVQGTWYYYKLLGVDKKDVLKIQYRGKGWPSGIEINLRNNETIKKANYTFPWNLVHESLLFTPKRCLYCNKKISDDSDVNIADPWLDEYIQNDTIGNSIVICQTEEAQKVINRLIACQAVVLTKIQESVFIESQKGTIEEKANIRKYKPLYRIVERLGATGSLYKRIVMSSLFLLKIHVKILKLAKKGF